ncbi:MAG: phage holin, lambda family [Gammaproteobacteria bacterium]|nr:phage holin, lambda family [Gammaproteobacteria bacterium]
MDTRAMPSRNPDFWSALLMWLSDREYYLWATFMGFFMGMLSTIYRGGKLKRGFLEGLIIGLLGGTLVPLLQWFDVPPEVAGAGACWMGLIGIDQLRYWAVRLGDRGAEK